MLGQGSSSGVQVGESEDLIVGRPYTKIQFSTGFLWFKIFVQLFDLLILHRVHRQLLNFLSSRPGFSCDSNM